jgi:hypothetical protein
MSDETSKSPLKIDIGAKVGFEVKVEIPTTSVGQFVDALTDIVRPWSEKRGLKADLIRLQREDVAFDIALRAKRRLEIGDRERHPVPLKVLIPLLEYGSQEAPDDEFMIEMWANLLASATKEGSIPPRFVSILGELNGDQARLFMHLASQRDADRMAPPIVGKDAQEHAIRVIMLDSKLTPAAAATQILASYRRSGTYVSLLLVSPTDDGAELYQTTDPDIATESAKIIDLSILTSLHLLEQVTIDMEIGQPQIRHIILHYYTLTSMAIVLFNALN